MSNMTHSEFGKCLTTKNALERNGRIKWCVREDGTQNIDNGWRFFSELDTEKYLTEITNWVVVDFDSIIEIDPALLALMWLPYGTEITIEYGDKEVAYNDSHTGIPVVNPLSGEILVRLVRG